VSRGHRSVFSGAPDILTPGHLNAGDRPDPEITSIGSAIDPAIVDGVAPNAQAATW
jgi:hypothetical protein